MHSATSHTLLSHLITLTNERDGIAAEALLVNALFDLISIDHGESNPSSVTIYRVTDIKKQQFSLITKGKASESKNLTLKQKLTDWFESNENPIGVQDDMPFTTFYPLKSPNNRTTAIVAITTPNHVLPQQESIRMLLQIFQNFTWLSHDNERDTLTGLLNRKSFENKINKVLAHITKTSKRKDDRLKQAYYLAIFDIDHFKHVNDTFGHLIGDEVLLLFSQLMTQTFRDTDMLFRFGGEEFLGVFEQSNTTDIASVLERFKEKISFFEFPQIGKVTVSAGYTTISADEISSKLIDRADSALYYAKNHGRNRICCYEQLVADGCLQAVVTKESDIELF